MSTLKCTECNKEFKAGFVNATKTVGTSGINVGIIKTFPIWPFQIRVVSACPNCGKNTKLLVVVSKTTKIITVSLILVIIIGLAFLIFNQVRQPNLLGSKKCESLLSWKEIQSICTAVSQDTPQESYSLQKKSVYANKFDDPNYSAGDKTLWDTNPGLNEECSNSFEGEGVSGIYLDIYSGSFNSPKNENINYSKDDVVDLLVGKTGNSQTAYFMSENKTMFLREVAQPVGVPLKCREEEMISLLKMVKSKID